MHNFYILFIVKQIRMRKEVLFVIIILFLLPSFTYAAAVQGHPASQIRAGTFDVGNFAFQADLTVDTNTLYVDSADNRVGIGTLNPLFNLHIDPSNTGDILNVGPQYNGGVAYNPGDKQFAISAWTGIPSLFITRHGVNGYTFSMPDATGLFTITDASSNTVFAAKGGKVGIGTASPSVKLDVAGGNPLGVAIKSDGYIQDVSGVVGGNLISSHSWTISTGSAGIFNQNGATTENSREWGVGPHGNSVLLWKATNDALNDNDGGWVTSYFPIDPNKAYRFTVWIMKMGSTDGTTYFGVYGSPTPVTSLAGVADTNPYFWLGDLPVLGRWYLLVGYVHGSGDPSTTSYGGIYDSTTGTKVISSTDFKWQATTTSAAHRSYLFYDVTTTDTQYWWTPRVEELNGDEPSIMALMNR